MSMYKIRPRAGTASQWSAANTTLGEREIGFEYASGGLGIGAVKMKMGDGSTKWNSLPYAFEVPDDRGTTDAWTSTKQYAKGDFTIYKNQTWIAAAASKGQAPGTGSNWTRVSLTGLKTTMDSMASSLASMNSSYATLTSKLSKAFVIKEVDYPNSVTISGGGSINLNLSRPTQTGYTCAGIIGYYCNGWPGCVLYSNGWIFNPRSTSVSITIHISWLMIKNDFL